MAALLGVNFGSQKHAYFQTRITIHELTNVPMVAGHFKAKWKVDHSHNLASAIASATATASTSTNATTNANSTLENHHANHTKQQQQQQQQHLNHRKSTSTLNSSFDRDENGSIRSESIRKAHHRGGDDASSTYSNSNKPKRKSSYRIFSGIRDALKPHSSSNPSSISTSRNAKSSRESQDERRSIDLRSDDGSEEASEVLADHHHHDRESSQQSNNSSHSNNHHSQQQHNHHHPQNVISNHLNYDPRGETSSANVKDNRVVWEKQINVGVRFNVEKPRQVSGGSHSGASLNEQAATNSSRSTDATMRRSLSQKDVQGSSAGGILQHDSSGVNTPRDTSGWSMLAPSELRISVKADVPTGIEGNHADHQTMMKFGHVSINLAEFAPHPHLHHHHHHHNQHHHHHHQSYSSGRPGAPHSSHSDQHHVLSRTETRRYLLVDGPTNATVKVTVEMKHVGGTREYQVPSNKRGLLVGSVVPSLDSSSPTGSKGPSSYAGSEADDAASSNGGSAEHTNSDSHATRSTSVTKALNDWSPHSVARHSRIPEENLRTKLTHKDTARAVKEAGGGGRLAFSFAAGAHHDRPPESVIDSIFDSNMLTPTPSRDKKASLQQKQKQGQEKPEQTPRARDMASKHLSIAGQSAKSRNSSASSKSGGIRWDASVEKAKSSPASIPESGHEELTPRSTKTSNESENIPESSRANPLSSTRRKEEHDAKTFGEENYRSSLPLQPPQTPPDVVRNDELSKAHPPLDYPPPWSETSTATETPPTSPSLHKKPSRRTLGLTKEAAMMAGYKGAGWGTLELSKHASNLSLDSSDSGSEHGNHSILHHHHRSPTFAYLHERTRSPSPSPLQQLAH